MAEKKAEKLTFQQTMDLLNKTYGKNSVLTFKGQEIETYDVISSSSIGIDYQVLGVGGFCKSKVYQLKGWQGSNKSTLCAHIVANCQKDGGKVVYIDGESAVDKKYFSQLGVEFDDSFILCQAEYGEMGFDTALQLINTGETDLVIIDSDSSLLPKSMMQGEIGAQTIGKKAKLNSETYPKLKVAVNKFNTCLISIAQYRVDPGKMFGDNRVVPGGHALDYYSDCIVELTKTLKKEGDEASGTITTVKTSKNKMYTPYKEFKVKTVFGFGISKIDDIIDIGNEYEIWKKWGENITYRNNKYPVDQFSELILSNPEFYEELKTDIVNKIRGINLNSVPAEEIQTQQ